MRGGGARWRATTLAGVVAVAGIAAVGAPVGADPYETGSAGIASQQDNQGGQSSAPSGLGDRLAIQDSGDSAAFVSAASDLAGAGDSNGVADVYWKHFATADVELVSLGVAGVQPDKASSSPAMSDDGRYVAFVTSASNLGISDVNNGPDVYLRDRQTDTTTRASVGHKPTGGGAEPSLSGDGRYVVFTSGGGVWRRDLMGGTTVEMSVSTGGTSSAGVCSSPSISDDGMRVAFTCDAAASDLVVNDTNGASDVFLRDIGTSSTMRVSLSNAGQQLPDGAVGGVLSGDGGTVGFVSSSPAVAGSGLGTEAYLRRLGGGGTVLASAADGTTDVGGPGAVLDLALSDDGNEVVFSASSPGGRQPFPTSAPSDVYYADLDKTCTTLISTAGQAGANGASRTPVLSTLTPMVVFASTATDVATEDDQNGATEDVFRKYAACVPAPSFSDVPLAHPFWSEIDWMVGDGITTGYDDGTFQPTRDVSRQAIASFLWKAAGSPEPTGPPPTFVDVPADHPFRSAIWWLVGEGVTTGYDDGTFRPAAPVSRQAIASFLWKLAGSPELVDVAVDFPDVPEGHPFRAAVAWMVANEITTGFVDGTFRPVTPVSRQAAAAFLERSDSLIHGSG